MKKNLFAFVTLALIFTSSIMNAQTNFTTSKTANDFYQKGLEELNKYWADMEKTDLLDKSEDLFRNALESDSTFGGAYGQLASIYEQKYWRTTNQSEKTLDSVFYLANKALYYDKSLSNSYRLKGWYFQVKSMNDKALEVYKEALSHNPNDFYAHKGLGELYRSVDVDIVRSLDHFSRALEIGGDESNMQNIYSELFWLFLDYGFKDLSKHYLEEFFKVGRDTYDYYSRQMRWGLMFRDYQYAREYSMKMLAIESMRTTQLEMIGIFYMFEHQYDSSLVYYRKQIERNESLGWELGFPRYFGYVLVQSGEVVEGEKYIDENFTEALDQLNQGINEWLTNVTLIEIYAYRGEKEEAIAYMRALSRQDSFSFFHLGFLNSPLIDNMRDDPEFHEVLNEIESTYQAKHDEIRQWLEENDML